MLIRYLLQCVCVCVLSDVQLFATPWTIACQAPLSMDFFRQEYWSGLPFPTPGVLSDPRTEPPPPVTPALASTFFTTVPLGSPNCSVSVFKLINHVENLFSLTV